MRPAAALPEGQALVLSHTRHAPPTASCTVRPCMSLLFSSADALMLSALEATTGKLQLCMLRQDDDPYVRKTAAVCVAKLYDINPELVEDRGFLDLLKARAPALSRPPCRAARLSRAEQHAPVVRWPQPCVAHWTAVALPAEGVKIPRTSTSVVLEGPCTGRQVPTWRTVHCLPAACAGRCPC